MNTEEPRNTDNPEEEVPTDQPDTSTSPGTTQTEAPAKPAEPQHILALRTAYALALATPDFTGDKKRVEKAIAALTLPDPETRVRAQLRSNAEKTLFAAAAKKATIPGNTFVPPTQEAIDKKVEEGVQEWRLQVYCAKTE